MFLLIKCEAGKKKLLLCRIPLFILVVSRMVLGPCQSGAVFLLLHCPWWSSAALTIFVIRLWIFSQMYISYLGQHIFKKTLWSHCDFKEKKRQIAVWQNQQWLRLRSLHGLSFFKNMSVQILPAQPLVMLQVMWVSGGDTTNLVINWCRSGFVNSKYL